MTSQSMMRRALTLLTALSIAGLGACGGVEEPYEVEQIEQAFTLPLPPPDEPCDSSEDPAALGGQRSIAAQQTDYNNNAVPHSYCDPLGTHETGAGGVTDDTYEDGIPSGYKEILCPKGYELLEGKCVPMMSD